MSKRRVKNITYNEEDDDYYSEDSYSDDTCDKDEDDLEQCVSRKTASPLPSTRLRDVRAQNNKKLPLQRPKSAQTAPPTTDASLLQPRVSKAAVSSCSKKRSDTTTAYEGTRIIPKQLSATSLTDHLPAQALRFNRHNKSPLNLVVVGHVDSGKSTMMGHLLHKVGVVSQRQMDKLQKASRESGKASFAYAWVFDEGGDERERGITVDVCIKSFETPTKIISILDSPGHQDFIPKMLAAAVIADVALLVVDAQSFDSGFSRSTQTKQHVQLVRALGIRHLLVAVNKMDALNWSQKAYTSVVRGLHDFITGPSVRYQENSVTYIPVSARAGYNIDFSSRNEKLLDCCNSPGVRENSASLENLDWWKCSKTPSLLDAIDQIMLDDNPTETQSPAATVSSPLIVCVSEKWPAHNAATVSGKIQTGTLSVGDTVWILPGAEKCDVLSIELQDTIADQVPHGFHVDKIRLSASPDCIHVGCVLCRELHALPVVTEVFAKVVVFESDHPLLPGQQVMSYVHLAQQPATVSRLVKLLCRDGIKQHVKHPRLLKPQDVAIVALEVERPVCVQWHEAKAQTFGTSILSRLILRHHRSTIAAGVIIASVTDPSSC